MVPLWVYPRCFVFGAVFFSAWILVKPFCKSFSGVRSGEVVRPALIFQNTIGWLCLLILPILPQDQRPERPIESICGSLFLLTVRSWEAGWVPRIFVLIEGISGMLIPRQMYWNGCNIWLNSCLSANWNLWPIAFVQVGHKSISFTFSISPALFYERIIFSAKPGNPVEGFVLRSCISYNYRINRAGKKSVLYILFLLNMTEEYWIRIIFAEVFALSIALIHCGIISFSHQVHILFGCHSGIFISIGTRQMEIQSGSSCLKENGEYAFSDRFLFHGSVYLFLKKEQAMSAYHIQLQETVKDAVSIHLNKEANQDKIVRSM